MIAPIAIASPSFVAGLFAWYSTRDVASPNGYHGLRHGLCLRYQGLHHGLCGEENVDLELDQDIALIDNVSD